MENKQLEKRIEKLEYYMRLMREYVSDIETFSFWEWIMNYELDEYEVNQILTVTKSYNENFKNGNTVKFDEYYSEIYSIMSSNENLSKLINPMFIKQMLLSLQKLMFKKMIDELLNNENSLISKGLNKSNDI